MNTCIQTYIYTYKGAMLFQTRGKKQGNKRELLMSNYDLLALDHHAIKASGCLFIGKLTSKKLQFCK